MPIKDYRKGDLLQAKEIFIAHGVNALGVMGAGIAKQIAVKYPDSELKYREYCYKDPTPMGKALATSEKSGEKVVRILFHMFTQEQVGRTKRQVDYGALARAFNTVNDSLKTMHGIDQEIARKEEGNAELILPPPTLAIPKIGAGLGGGSWPIIEEIINGCTPDINVIVYEHVE